MVETFYDSNYWAAQAAVGDFFSRANRERFEAYCHPEATLLDFGCAGGWLLRDLPAAKRVGIEVNPNAHSVLRINGIEPHTSLASVPSGSIDVAISNHALEHVAAPLDTIREVFRVLRPGGFAVFVVPSESVLSRFKSTDKDQHLYTWAPANLGNLFRAAGFRVHSCRPLIYRSPPKALLAQRLLGWPLYQALCRVWGLVSWHMFQVKIVAHKP